MYSPSVTQQHIEKVEAQTKLKLYRHDASKVIDWAEQLKRIYNEGKPLRDLRKEELDFIRNEQILVKIDYHYFAERYSALLLDSGGLGRLRFWKSQDMIFELIAKLETKSWDQLQRKESTDGIKIGLNKSRQLGATSICRSIIMHRECFWEHTRGFSASVDEDKTLELYQKDKRIYDNLPYYLQPSLDPRDGSFDKKAEHLSFGKMDSFLLYQSDAQKSGLGQGRQFDVSHLTECASFSHPDLLIKDFFPTMPQSYWCFCIAESTPQGFGNWWHDWISLIKDGHLPQWNYLFIPAYIEPKKYGTTFPVDWIPDPNTMKYAKLIEETSAETVGYKMSASKEHLYWYERERAQHQHMNTLALFMTNYAPTSEMSFQHFSGAAFPPELIEQSRLNVREPVSYDFLRAS